MLSVCHLLVALALSVDSLSRSPKRHLSHSVQSHRSCLCFWHNSRNMSFFASRTISRSRLSGEHNSDSIVSLHKSFQCHLHIISALVCYTYIFRVQFNSDVVTVIFVRHSSRCTAPKERIKHYPPTRLPASMQGSISFSGNVAKCASFTACVDMLQTSRLLRLSVMLTKLCCALVLGIPPSVLFPS